MSILHDTRHAFRRLIHHPGQAAVAIVTLAIGLAVSAALFTVTRDVVLRPFPFRDPGRLVALWANDTPHSVPHLELTYYQFEQVQKRARSIEESALVSAANFQVVVNTPEPHQVVANEVSRDFFHLLGIKAAAGRTFVEADHKPNAPGAVMISDRLWHSLFGGNPAVIGRPIDVEGTKFTVAGVLPAHVDYPRDAEIIFPLEPFTTSEDAKHSSVFQGIARLRGPLATAQSEMKTLAASMQSVNKVYNKAYKGVSITATPLAHDILGVTRPAMTILFAMALLVLAIATLNVSSLFVAQVVARQRELAIRSALGARKARLVRTLLFEALAVAVVATAAGYGIAHLLVRAFFAAAPASMPRVTDVAISPGTYAFLAVAAIVVSVVCALVASLRIGSGRTIRAGIDRTGAAVASRRLLASLAAVEIGVAVTLLAGAALMIRSFSQVASIDPGFRRDHVLTAQIPLPGSSYGDKAVRLRFFRDLLKKLQTAPGVSSAGVVLVRPLELELGWDHAFTLDGQSAADQEKNPLANLLSCSPRYFDAIGTPLLRGRAFTDDDREETAPVIVVSRSFARRFWHTDDVVGKRVKAGRPGGKGPWRTIVGVVADVRFRALTTEKLDVYEPYTQSRWTPQYVALRTSGPPRAAESALRSIVSSIDRSVPVAAVRTTSELIDVKLAQPRVNAWVVGAFAAVALFLSVVGIYAVLSYVVRSRTMEMGVRMALGAEARSLLQLVLGQAARLALYGALGGILGAFIVSRLLSRFLYGIDGAALPLTALAAATLVLAAVAGALIPGWRASRVDPVVALRCE
jgi:putative ABC transport system permease protein